jgi:hypothetical protein
MPRKIKLPVFSRMIAIALMAILLSSEVVSAVTNDLTVDPTADLASNRTEATVTGVIECTKGTSSGTASITVYIFQSVGRLLNIGIESLATPLNCTGEGFSDPWQVTVNAISGLRFQPGPATVIVKVATAVDGIADPATTEKGFKVRLHN